MARAIATCDRHVPYSQSFQENLLLSFVDRVEPAAAAQRCILLAAISLTPKLADSTMLGMSNAMHMARRVLT